MTSAGRISSGGPLAVLGSEALNLFHDISKALEDETPDGWQMDLFTNEAERFRLWSANLGLFAPGHGSLDYRVREAERLVLTLKRFLQQLISSLHDVITTRKETVQKLKTDDQQDEASELGESEDEDEDSESDLELLLDGIRDPINRLFKMATKIRAPSARFGWLRAANYQQVDKDTGVDFLQATMENERDYVRSMFLQYEKSRACQSSDPTPPDGSSEENVDWVWEPIRSVLCHQDSTTESFLVNRLALANVRRRRQFAYWVRHREKLTTYTHPTNYKQPTETELQSASPQLPQTEVVNIEGPLAPKRAPTVTTATALNVPKFEAMENRSTWTVSEYAQSTWQPAREKVDFPTPPKRHFGAGFECPYCFTICSRETLAEKAWKAHLIHDLRPYICTYEHCSNPSQLYDTREEWSQHENSVHRRVWRCLEHSDRVYIELDQFEHHMRRTHAESNHDESSLAHFIQASESVQDAADRACPICMVTLDSTREMEIHIALHLERFALFSLPRSAVDNDESESNAESDKAQRVVEEDSREGGFSDGSDLEHGGSVEADHVSLEDETELLDNTMELTESAIEPLQKLFHSFRSMDNVAQALRIQGKHDEAEQFDVNELSHASESKSTEKDQMEPWRGFMETFWDWFRIISFDAQIKPKPIKIAIIDDGVDASLTDIQSRIAGGVSFSSYPNSSDLMNAYYAPSRGHGSLMARLICDTCPESQLYVARLEEHSAKGGDPEYTTKTAAQAITWAVECNVDIILMSCAIQSQQCKTLEIAELKSAFDMVKKQGILMFCSAVASDSGSYVYETTYPSELGPYFRIGAARDILPWTNEDRANYLVSAESVLYQEAKNQSGEVSHKIASRSSIATARAAGLAGALLYSDRAVNNPPKLSGQDSMDNVFNALAEGSGVIHVHKNLVGPFSKIIMDLTDERESLPADLRITIWEDDVARTALRNVLDHLVEQGPVMPRSSQTFRVVLHPHTG